MQMPATYDSCQPDFVNRIHERIAVEYRDQCIQLRHEAEDAYCKAVSAQYSPANDARYELSKRHLQVTRGLLAEAADIVNSYCVL